jgi:hypothetical protein
LTYDEKTENLKIPRESTLATAVNDAGAVADVSHQKLDLSDPKDFETHSRV